MSEIIACSFCMKSNMEAKTLIAGPVSVYICEECVMVCVHILVDAARVKRFPSAREQKPA